MVDLDKKLKSIEEQKSPSFHVSVGPMLTYGQCFGLLPADGVLAKDENQVEFRWKSFKTIYSIVFLVLGTLESCLGTRRLLRLGFNIGFAEGLLFFITAMVRAWMFFALARSWKSIIKNWRDAEEPFLKPPYRVKGWSLRRKLGVVFVLGASSSLSKK